MESVCIFALYSKGTQEDFDKLVALVETLETIRGQCRCSVSAVYIYIYGGWDIVVVLSTPIAAESETETQHKRKLVCVNKPSKATK